MKVSVIVATYNQRSTIERALDSVLGQNAPDFDFEVIIGDDCSTDGTTEICRAYARRHPGKVRLIERPENLGVQGNYFDCVLQASGQYLADCAGDDQWTSPSKLAMQVAMLDAHPDMTLCHTAWVCRDAQSGQFTAPHAPYTGPNIAPAGSMLVPTLQHRKDRFAHLCSAMWRREPLARDLAAHPDLYLDPQWRLEDLQITCLMAASGSFGYIPEVTMAYTVGGSTISSEENREKSFRLFLATARLTRRLQQHYGVDDASLADFYSQRISHIFTLAFGLADRDKCHTALALAKEYGASLSPKAKMLRCLTLTPLTWHPVAAFLRHKR